MGIVILLVLPLCVIAFAAAVGVATVILFRGKLVYEGEDVLSEDVTRLFLTLAIACGIPSVGIVALAFSEAGFIRELFGPRAAHIWVFTACAYLVGAIAGWAYTRRP